MTISHAQRTEILLGPSSLDPIKATTLCVALRLRNESYSSVIDMRHLKHSGHGLASRVRILVTHASDVRASLAGHSATVGLLASASRKMTEPMGCGSVLIRHDHPATVPLFISTRAAVFHNLPYLQLGATNFPQLPLSITCYLEITPKGENT